MADFNFDMSVLTERITQIKSDTKEVSDCTMEYLECLMKRYALKESIPEHFKVEDVPDDIIELLRSGELPSEDRIATLDPDTQTSLVFDLIWACGIKSVYEYVESTEEPQEVRDEFFDSILALLDISPAHVTGCYIIAVLTLIMHKIPSVSMIETITNNFDDSETSIHNSREFFVECASSLIFRWRDEKNYSK
jgi:hypothetical protein